MDDVLCYGNAMQDSYAIAVDLGATNVRVALVARDGKILARARDKTDKSGKGGRAIAKQIVSLVKTVLGESNTPLGRVAGIGVSSFGPLDHKKGGVKNAANVPYLFIPLLEPLKTAFGRPVTLLNDANAAALAEQKFGAGRGVNNLVYITISTGIGAGVIADGKLLLGKGGNAGEVGHFIIDTFYNIFCGCGQGAGHWEAYASGRNIPRFFRAWAEQKGKRIAYRPAEAHEVFKKAREDDQAAKQFLEELSRVNARAISNVILAYDPEVIILGGSVALNNRQAILHGIKKYIDHFLPPPVIRVTSLGEDIVLLGAGAAAFEERK